MWGPSPKNNGKVLWTQLPYAHSTWLNSCPSTLFFIEMIIKKRVNLMSIQCGRCWIDHQDLIHIPWRFPKLQRYCHCPFHPEHFQLTFRSQNLYTEYSEWPSTSGLHHQIWETMRWVVRNPRYLLPWFNNIYISTGLEHVSPSRNRVWYGSIWYMVIVMSI